MAQDLVGSDALAAGKIAEIGGPEHRHGALVTAETAVDVKRRPRIFFLVLAADIRIAQRRGKGRFRIHARQCAADVDEYEAYRAAYRRVGAPAGSEAADAGIEVERTAHGAVDQQERRHRVGA